MTEIEIQEKIVANAKKNLEEVEEALFAFCEWLQKRPADDYETFKDGYLILERMYLSRADVAESIFDEEEKKLNKMVDELNSDGLDEAFASWNDFYAYKY